MQTTHLNRPESVPPVMTNSLTDHWKSQRAPIVNGIIFPNGTVHPVLSAGAPRHLPLHLRIEGEEQVTLDGRTQWTGITPSVEVADAGLGLTAITGECGMGCDGCIVLLENPNHRIRWLAFFDFSNPFESLAFEAGHVVARNNLNEIWKLPIDGKGAIEVRSNKSYA